MHEFCANLFSIMAAIDRACISCKKTFLIDDNDLNFYGRIKVPPPTWCPECRMIRRMSFWNVRNFFKRTDDSGRIFFSSYPENSFKVIDRDIWWSDEFDAAKYSREYDFSRSFFDQFKELLSEVPLPASDLVQSIGSEYCNFAYNIKNCYMCFNFGSSEDCLYCVSCGFLKNVVDSTDSAQSEACYELYGSSKNYRVFFSAYTSECRDSYFLYNCSDCSDCFGCVNLRHKQYYIWNQPYSKEEYFEKLKEMNLGSYETLTNVRRKFGEFIARFPKKHIQGSDNSNVSGGYINKSKGVKLGFQIYNNCENIAYSQSLVTNAKDSYDHTNWGDNSELIYESVDSGRGVRDLKFCLSCFDASQGLEYSIGCFAAEDSFGSVGLKRQKYCILNKQYSKEEYYDLKARIIEQMDNLPYVDKMGRVFKYGDFFPMDLSPFPANDSALIDFLDVDEAACLNQGLSWRHPVESEYKTTISADNLPDHINQASESILKEIIECLSCKRGYRIIPKELEFYKTFNLPIPRRCHNCRFKERNSYKSNVRFFERSCQCSGEFSSNKVYKNTSLHYHGNNACVNKFITVYDPQKTHIVYCEQCYISEVV